MTALKPKISIVGAGSVGATFAYTLIMRGLAREIALIDKNIKKAEGECMDLNHGLSLAWPAKIYASDFSGCSGSDIVVITAGAKQKPGQSRLDLVKTNIDIFRNVVSQITKYAKDAIIVVVTNPVDILTYATLKFSGLPKNKVFGSGTVLDSSRLRYSISEHCNVDPRDVNAYIIGEHGDTELPVWSNANIGGMNFSEYCPTCEKFDTCNREKSLDEIFKSVKDAAYKIIEAKGATYYAIGLALARIVQAVLRDESSVLPVSSLIENYYDINDVALSLPSVVDRNGVNKFLKINLSDKEIGELKHSAESLKDILKTMKF